MSCAQFRQGRPTDTLVASLHFLEMASPDPRGLACFYERAMGYDVRVDDDAIVASGPDRNLIFRLGAPKTLLRAGFALPDQDELERLADRIVQAGYSFRRSNAHLLGDAIETSDPDGNRFVFGLPRDPQPSAEKVRKLPARLQHVVVASRTPADVVSFFTEGLGFTLSDDVLDAEGCVRTSFLRCSREHHSFAVFKAAEDRLDHHCYETSDWNMIRDWADHMASEHIPIQWGPGRHGPGNNLFLFVHDPDGNWVEISAELELVDHGRPVGQWPHEQRTLNSWGQGLLRS
ncbi:VOC family protein [Novosphingobium resinovorum]|uniref:VOC family protein n=1 Tax=Novosphingobium resinovorum TaxID=158500 RepID=UPI002ED5F78B